MAKRRRSPQSVPAEPVRPKRRLPRPGIVHTSVYLPTAVHDALRSAAFRERVKIHDIVIEGVKMALGKRGWK
jgi:hypothetical protein